MDEERIREIIREEIAKIRVHQSMIIPGAVTDRHIGLGERAQGDILYIDSVKRLKLLNAGTSGGALITGGSDANPAWSTPDTGWAVTNKEEDKTLDCNVNDTLVTSDVVGTLIDVLISIGILSA
jgi:hypothetical protein